jgi:tetratricopeptide (TPR) repeat protein
LAEFQKAPMIAGILFERHGLEPAARKDADWAKPGTKQSNFVLFISKLQEFLPERSRQFTHSDGALTQAIHRARESFRTEKELISKWEFEAAARRSELAAKIEQRELDRIANARAWRHRDREEAFFAQSEETEDLVLSSNEAADLVRDGKLEAAELAAKALLERFSYAHDGWDRLGMVHEARGDMQQAAECYRKAIEVIRQHPEDYEPGFEKTFTELVNRLDPPIEPTSPT